MKRLILILLCLLHFGCDENQNKITLENLEAMFQDVAENTDWNMKDPMLWGYFFTHHEPGLLETAKSELENKGYRFVGLFITEKEDENEPDLWWLHVEKEEVHTPMTLDRRNKEFYSLASKLGLQSYDGMDVGPIKD